MSKWFLRGNKKPSKWSYNQALMRHHENSVAFAEFSWDEYKYIDSPQLNKSMQTAAEILKLDHLFVIFPGKNSFPLANGVTAIG